MNDRGSRGKRNIIHSGPRNRGINYCIGWVEQMSVYCTGCGSQITVRASEARYWKDGSPDEDAIDVWNKRAGDEK